MVRRKDSKLLAITLTPHTQQKQNQKKHEKKTQTHQTHSNTVFYLVFICLPSHFRLTSVSLPSHFTLFANLLLSLAYAIRYPMLSFPPSLEIRCLPSFVPNSSALLHRNVDSPHTPIQLPATRTLVRLLHLISRIIQISNSMLPKPVFTNIYGHLPTFTSCIYILHLHHVHHVS